MSRDQRRRDRIAQWAFDTRPVLGRFHLWLADVETRRVSGPDAEGPDSFVGGALERAFVTATAVTALGTRLFGRYGEGVGLDQAALNRVKKDSDAISAYALSEGLWYLTRNLPENHAVMVCLGEGLMPKAGEAPEMGSNPLLGFGRVYARPEVARFLDRRVHRLLNDASYGWNDFWREVEEHGVTVWGAAVDTLECTKRFAQGETSGPMTLLHLFDQPLRVTCPYEGYVGTLMLPREVVERAALDSRLLTYRTPRRMVLEEIRRAFPDVEPERVHVWTLGGPQRRPRLGDLWNEWSQLGAHVVENGWTIPGGGAVFTDSGTYAPVFRVGAFRDGEGRRHVFLIDGYAASAEAIQAASLDPILGTSTSMTLFSSQFKAPHHREAGVMQLDTEADDFDARLAAHLGRDVGEDVAGAYRDSIRAARDADMPGHKPFVAIDDFLPKKSWRLLALSGFMLPDPYSGAPGVEKVDDGIYRVTVRAATQRRIDEVTLTLRLMESPDESRLVFSPLLDRFYATRGKREYRERAVKVSDSGRIRNELQTLCLEALDFPGNDRIRVDLSRVDDAVLPADKKQLIREVLAWYKEHHPIWFWWLELA
ncbi:MAG TPA: hypothetical protein VGG06_26615 [Thermoanaerobaculia bacterium]|jgi:hypothetical protein